MTTGTTPAATEPGQVMPVVVRLRIGDWYYVRWKKSSRVEIGQFDLATVSPLLGLPCLHLGGVVVPEKSTEIEVLGRCPTFPQMCDIRERATRMSNCGLADRCKAGNEILDVLEDY